MAKEIAFTICANFKSGEAEQWKVKCTLCEQDCWYSGVGHSTMEKYSNGAPNEIDEEKYQVKIICNNCMDMFFFKKLQILKEVLDFSDRRHFIQQVENMLKNNINNKNNDTQSS